VEIEEVHSGHSTTSIVTTARFVPSFAALQLPELDRPNHFSVPIEYFNENREQEFLPGAVFFCGGTLALDLTDKTEDLLLSIKAESALV
jgi:hypothetical protein